MFLAEGPAGRRLPGPDARLGFGLLGASLAASPAAASENLRGRRARPRRANFVASGLNGSRLLAAFNVAARLGAAPAIGAFPRAKLKGGPSCRPPLRGPRVKGITLPDPKRSGIVRPDLWYSALPRVAPAIGNAGSVAAMVGAKLWPMSIGRWRSGAPRAERPTPRKALPPGKPRSRAGPPPRMPPNWPNPLFAAPRTMPAAVDGNAARANGSRGAGNARGPRVPNGTPLPPPLRQGRAGLCAAR
mmetsp:Transcript_73204/g.203044  ORF Transcript_73204/g.203044 Transcript_73204/m.203044 type:complete len:245 (+) Transcript_73204:1747-2481(+)